MGLRIKVFFCCLKMNFKVKIQVFLDVTVSIGKYFFASQWIVVASIIDSSCPGKFVF